MSPLNPFFRRLHAACGGVEGKGEKQGRPLHPPKGLAAPLNPAEPVFRVLQKFGMTHNTERAATRREGFCFEKVCKPMQMGIKAEGQMFINMDVLILKSLVLSSFTALLKVL